MTLRGATYYYKRHRTIDVAELDKKQPQIRLLLKTDDLAECRQSVMCWSVQIIIIGHPCSKATTSNYPKKYDKIKRRANALCYSSKSAHELVSEPIIRVDRLETLILAINNGGGTKLS